MFNKNMKSSRKRRWRQGEESFDERRNMAQVISGVSEPGDESLPPGTAAQHLQELTAKADELKSTVAA